MFSEADIPFSYQLYSRVPVDAARETVREKEGHQGAGQRKGRKGRYDQSVVYACTKISQVHYSV
jgi:hypothetical protein